MGLLGKALRLVSDMEKTSGEQARLVDGACSCWGPVRPPALPGSF